MDNKNPIIKDNYPVTGKNKTIYIAHAELIAHGCKNCVWKLHDQCPHGLTGNGFKDEGICDEFLNFILSFATGNDSISAVWEKFNIYVMRLQSLEDYKEMMNLGNEIKQIEAEKGYDKTVLMNLEAKKNAYKLWWYKLQEVAQKGLRGIVDREKKESPNARPKLTVQQLNIMINASAKELAEMEKKLLEDKNK